MFLSSKTLCFQVPKKGVLTNNNGWSQGYGAGLFWDGSSSWYKRTKVWICFELTTNCLKYVLTHVPVHIGPDLDLL